MRICPNDLFRLNCLTRSWSDRRARFSWPEYVWTTNHFSLALGSLARPPPSVDCVVFSPSLAIDRPRYPGPEQVEQTEKDGGDDHGYDDDDRGCEGLFARR